MISIERTDQARYRLAFKMQRNKASEQWVLLTSDEHFDNPKCRRDLLKEDLDEALERKAIICNGGDLFCAMQGWGDPRGGKDDIRPEHNNGRYLDSLVDSAEEFYRPYAKNIAFIARGNHELSVIKRKETDLTERLVSRLNANGAANIVALPICSHIMWRIQTKFKTDAIRMYLHHGYGGGGPVTKGVIQTNRMATYLSDADIVWSGHIHEQWVMPIKRDGTTEHGKAVQSIQWHVRTPTYKDEFQAGGWHDLRGGPPKPIGCVWMRIHWDRRDEKFKAEFQPRIR